MTRLIWTLDKLVRHTRSDDSEVRYWAADRLIRHAADDPSQQIEHAYRLALCRSPRPNEVELCRRFLAEMAGKDKDHRRALVQLCRVILNLNEFVYVE